MWEWNLNWSEVRDNLIIGSCPLTAGDVKRIRDETNITALMSLQSDACRDHFGIDFDALAAYCRGKGLVLVNSPMLDFDPPDQRRALPQAVRSLRELLDAEHRVYLYCTAGCNRAPLVALAYFNFIEMMDVDLAYAMIHAARPQADPYWEAFNGCRQDLIDVMREDILVRAYYLSQEESGRSPEDNWAVAERELIRGAFVNGALSYRRRLDPNRL